MARAVLPYTVRAAGHLARRHALVVRGQGVTAYTRWTLLKAWLAWRRLRAGDAYRFVSEDAARARRRSDTVFVFGSGYSLNDLAPAEWDGFAEHDVLGFSGFVYQRWVRTDFHLVRGWDYGEAGSHRRWLRSARAYAEKIVRTPHFAETTFVLQDDYTAVFARTLLGYHMLPRGSRILTYRTRRTDAMMPSPQISDGLAHGTGTLCDAVNLAYVLGWKDIVLVGVDLYDSRYFWAPPDRAIAFADSGEMIPALVNFRGKSATDSHHVLRNGLVDVMGQWATVFRAHGVRLSVYNPRSLLNGVLPLYENAVAAPTVGRLTS